MDSFICTWLMPGRLNSTGSSAVIMLVSVVFRLCSAEYRVEVLPDPVGPVTSTMPYGLLMLRLNLSRLFDSKPSCVISRRRFSLSRSRSTSFSPKIVGSVETRKSSSRERPSRRTRILMRPSCGKRFSAMSSRAMIFMREVSASRIFIGGFMIL